MCNVQIDFFLHKIENTCVRNIRVHWCTWLVCPTLSTIFLRLRAHQLHFAVQASASAMVWSAVSVCYRTLMTAFLSRSGSQFRPLRLQARFRFITRSAAFAPGAVGDGSPSDQDRAGCLTGRPVYNKQYYLHGCHGRRGYGHDWEHLVVFECYMKFVKDP